MCNTGEERGVELRAPYVIDAIGSPTTLSGALAFDGGFIDDVELDSGKVAVQEADRIEVASTRRHTQPRYAQPDPGQ